MTIFSGQSVISRVYTSRFGNGTDRLEPRPKVVLKKYQVLYPVENPPKVNRTMQCKSAIRCRCLTRLCVSLVSTPRKRKRSAEDSHKVTNYEL